jgi:acyl-CoA reductase-like NAD-dependent aldehyde dehydrogenase
MKRQLVLSIFLLILSATALVANAQEHRDHLTPLEEDLVKDTQILDKRIEVFIKAADRRLLALNGTDAAATKQLKKDQEKWGELPTGSRAELIRDVAKILDEAITNIDDVSSRDERNPLIPKALRRLAAEANIIVEKLRPLQAQAKGEAELASFEELMENAESIMQAANKLPPPANKNKKEKKNDKTN